MSHVVAVAVRAGQLAAVVLSGREGRQPSTVRAEVVSRVSRRRDGVDIRSRKDKKESRETCHQTGSEQVRNRLIIRSRD